MVMEYHSNTFVFLKFCYVCLKKIWIQTKFLKTTEVYLGLVLIKVARFTYVKLSKKGKEFQKHLIGSTNVYQPNVKEFRNIVNIKTG